MKRIYEKEISTKIINERKAYHLFHITTAIIIVILALYNGFIEKNSTLTAIIFGMVLIRLMEDIYVIIIATINMERIDKELIKIMDEDEEIRKMKKKGDKNGRQ